MSHSYPGGVPANRPTALRKWLRARLLERTLRGLPRTDAVLDLGCGYGFYFEINPRAVGIDGDPAAVAELQSLGCQVIHGDLLEPLPFPDQRFDWVVAHDVLEHFVMEELRHIVSEVSRVLRPGGRFVVLVPNRKGYDYGVRAGVGHRLYVREPEISELCRDAFAIEATYPEPLPRFLGRFFAHNKEVFVLRRG